ncbi:MAG: 50S ribosomal protein L11 methyltransferase [Hyphomicrobiales bacterium]
MPESDGLSVSGRIVDRAAFVRSHTCALPVPLAPEIELLLADEATALWKKTEEELETIGLPPPYWAFAWAGGQALARYLLDRPDIVAGRRVLDFASGSGLVAIAAMKAGAASVIAADIDGFAGVAMALNAAANGVELEIETGNLLGRPMPGLDVLLAGDIFYEWPASRDIMLWFESLAAAGTTVLIGDPDRLYLPKDKLVRLADYEVPVTRALEDFSIKKTAVWGLAASPRA